MSRVTVVVGTECRETQNIQLYVPVQQSVYLTCEDLEHFGFATKCPGRVSPLIRTARHAHMENCRKRIETELRRHHKGGREMDEGEHEQAATTERMATTRRTRGRVAAARSAQGPSNEKTNGCQQQQDRRGWRRTLRLSRRQDGAKPLDYLTKSSEKRNRSDLTGVAAEQRSRQVEVKEQELETEARLLAEAERSCQAGRAATEGLGTVIGEEERLEEEFRKIGGGAKGGRTHKSATQ